MNRLHTSWNCCGNVPLPGHAVSQICILNCFVQYIKYICGISDRQFDLRYYHMDQYDNFRTNLCTPDQPIYEEIGWLSNRNSMEIGWLSNRNSMVEEFVTSLEEMAKRRGNKG